MRSKFKVTKYVPIHMDSFFSPHVNQPHHSGIQLFKIWPWNSKAKVIIQSHNWSNTLPTQTLFISCQSTLPFPRYSFYKIWPWKSDVKVRGEAKVQSYKTAPTSSLLTSLPFHWHPAARIHFFYLTLTIHGQCHSLRSHGFNILSTNIHFVPC